MPRPLHALISRSALVHNLQRARHFAPGARVWAVVKADAYGHGLLRAMAAFADADGLALLEFDGARRLRQAGWHKPILMIEGPFDMSDVLQARELRLSLVVHQTRQIDWLRALPGGAGAPIDVSLKFNSGMHRLGFAASQYKTAWQQLRGLPTVGEITLMTHFANADQAGGLDQALPAFLSATRDLPGPRCVCNSAATIDHPEIAWDWIRPGVMLYGGTPFDERDPASLGLRAAMSLRSRLLAIQHLQAGDTVGYGSRFRADHAMRIGVVACGYADGYPRHAPVGTPVIVDGVRTRTAGRVAMDMMMVDLDPVPQAQLDSEVELWGTRLPIDEVASAAGTIGYELMCALAPRVPVIESV